MYPGIFTGVGIAHATFAFSKVARSWSQTIRDKEFVVEMRLRNHDPELEKTAIERDPTPQVEEVMQDVQDLPPLEAVAEE